MSNHIHCKVWNEITYAFSNFNGATIEVWQWISNFIPHFNEHVIANPCWDKSLTMLMKRAPAQKKMRETTFAHHVELLFMIGSSTGWGKSFHLNQCWPRCCTHLATINWYFSWLTFLVLGLECSLSQYHGCWCPSNARSQVSMVLTAK